MKTGFQIAGMFVFVLGVQLLTPKLSDALNLISHYTEVLANGSVSNHLARVQKVNFSNSLPEDVIAKQSQSGRKDDKIPAGSSGTARRG